MEDSLDDVNVKLDVQQYVRFDLAEFGLIRRDPFVEFVRLHRKIRAIRLQIQTDAQEIPNASRHHTSVCIHRDKID